MSSKRVRIMKQHYERNAAASHLKEEMRSEVMTAEKRCDVLVGRMHNLQDDLKNQPNNHSILGSAKHVNQLLLEILELLNG